MTGKDWKIGISKAEEEIVVLKEGLAWNGRFGGCKLNERFGGKYIYLW